MTGALIATLGEYVEDFRIHGKCPRCGRINDFDRDELLQQFSRNIPLDELANAVECRKCGGIGCRLFTSFRGRREMIAQ